MVNRERIEVFENDGRPLCELTNGTIIIDIKELKRDNLLSSTNYKIVQQPALKRPAEFLKEMAQMENRLTEANARLTAHVERLSTENIELRDRVATLGGQNDQLKAENTGLKEANARLTDQVTPWDWK